MPSANIKIAPRTKSSGYNSKTAPLKRIWRFRSIITARPKTTNMQYKSLMYEIGWKLWVIRSINANEKKVKNRTTITTVHCEKSIGIATASNSSIKSRSIKLMTTIIKTSKPSQKAATISMIVTLSACNQANSVIKSLIISNRRTYQNYEN